jgi:hypothetical protein
MMSLLRVPSRTSARDVPTIVGLLPKHLLLASALGARIAMVAKLAWNTRIAESHALAFMSSSTDAQARVVTAWTALASSRS